VSGADDLGSFSLLDLFRAEAEQHLATLETVLVALESDPTDAKRLEELMRAAHSIKGAARIVGLDVAVRVAHAMEDGFVAAQKGQVRLAGPAIDVLLAGTDLLKTVTALDPASAPAALTARQAEIQALVERLKQVGRGEAVEAPAPRPTAPAPPPAPAAPVPAAEAPVQAAQVPVPAAQAPAPPVPPADVVRPAAAAGGEATAPSEPPPPASVAAAPEDTAVRVSAQGLTRILAYAGETLVEARRLTAQAGEVESLRRLAHRLVSAVERFGERLGGGADAVRHGDALAHLRTQAARVRDKLSEQGQALETSARRGEDLADRLYAEVLASRMRPFGDVLGGFPRLVRDLARELGKRTRFRIEGRDVLVDRDILDRMEAPLNHLLRNALDHGMESPEARVAAGKPAEGLLRVEARHRGGMFEVLVEDDGRGVDIERVRARVVERGLIGSDIAGSLSENELLEFLFLPGFSTREQVTQVSGRGVGLDVVHSFAQQMGGSARVESVLGKGTRFVLVLPITRSVLRAALVEVGGEPFAFPLTRIERLLRLDAGDVRSAEGRQHYVHEDQPVGVISASEVLGVPPGKAASEHIHVVQLVSGQDRYGLAVERFLGEEDLVVRPLDARLGKVANLSAAAILEDGDPVLIVDTDDLVRSVDALLHQGRMRTIRVTARREETQRRARKRVLVVDDSRTVREVERGLLSSRGYLVDVAVDGSDGWNAVRGGDYALVITDVDMPRMNGIELTRRIKQDPNLRKIPVMIVSYKDREEDRQRGLEAGAEAYVTKSSFQEAGWIDSVVDLVGEP
jgi:two-component system sensor histidine kinase and response regulator WspE